MASQRQRVCLTQSPGIRAAQVVPHTHFHIIPRPGDVPDPRARSWTIFGRGQREELDEEDAEILIEQMRQRLVKEMKRVEAREGPEAISMLLGGGGWEVNSRTGHGRSERKTSKI